MERKTLKRAAILWIALPIALLTACPTPEVDTTAPAAVSGLQGIVGDEAVTLTWLDPTDADLSFIRLSHDKDPDLEYQVPGGVGSLTVGGLCNDTTYIFAVRAIDQAGNASEGVSVTLTPACETTAPGKVADLVLTPGDGAVLLAWTDPTDADLNHVEITHDQTGGTVPILVGAGVETAVITGLTNGTTYVFTLRASDTSGNLSEGVAGSVVPQTDITAPGEVTGLSLTPGDGSVLLEWTDPTDADLNHVEITHDQTGGSVAILVSAGVESAVIPGLENGTTHVFTVKAADISGNVSVGVSESAVPQTDITAPGEVTGLSLTPGDGSVLLAWTDPTDTDLNHVEITHDQAGGAIPMVVAAGLGQTRVSGLTNGAPHTFTLRTVDHTGNTSVGVDDQATPVSTDSTPPDNVTALAISVGDTQVTLTWADPLSLDFEHVEITHDLAGGATPVVVAAGVQTATLTALTNGLTYTFTVRTADEAQNKSTGATVQGSPDATGNLDLTISFADPNNPTVIVGGASAVLNRTLSQTMTLSASAGGQTITAYEWYVDGVLRSSGASWTLSATSYTAGVHQLAVFVLIAGKYYSGQTTFTVVN